MLRSTIVIMARTFLRNLSYSLVTMSGLVIGITVAIITLLWVRYELSFNSDNPDADRIYQVLANERANDGISTDDWLYLPNSADFPVKELPDVEAATRTAPTTRKISHGENWVQKDGIYADTECFRIFHTTIVAGDLLHPFADNRSIAISQSMARLLFEDGDGLGKTIQLNRDSEFKVTTVYRSFPGNGELNSVDFVLPFGSRRVLEDDNAWGNEHGWSKVYLKLYHTSSPEAVEEKINARRREIFGEHEIEAMLFRMTDWRLHWSFKDGKQSGGRIVYVVTFGIAAMFILIMACVNYVNTSTARAIQRAREIGVRKMNGATRRVLIGQFMTESLAMTFLSMVVASMAVFLLLPLVNHFLVDTSSFSLTDPVLVVGLLFLLFFTALLAGSYPAIVLSSLKPVNMLNGSLFFGTSGAGVRRTLVIFQFSLSVVMIFCALVMWQQTSYLLNKDLGYDRRELIAVSLLENTAAYPKDFPYRDLKAEIQNHTSIVSAAYGISEPMEINAWTDVNRVAAPFPDPVILSLANIDESYLPTAKLEIVQGRNFSDNIASDSSNFIINEMAVDALGFDDPIGQRITANDKFIEGEIIGVVRDFHHIDIHLPVKPLVFVYLKPQYIRKLMVRYRPGHLDEAIKHIRAIHQKFQPGSTFSYDVIDRDFEEKQLYDERFLQRLSACFTIVTIVIACLGLFGLTLFTVQRRTKEIGIRKVLGASVQEIVMMLGRVFVKPVIISFVIGFPVANYVMEKFLEGYPFRVHIPWTLFLVVGCAMAVLVLVTASYQSLQAAMKNPVDSLKTE